MSSACQDLSLGGKVESGAPISAGVSAGAIEGEKRESVGSE
jgi:hypothetical protein